MNGDFVLPLLRGLHVAAVLSLFGALVFRVTILPAGSSGQVQAGPALEKSLVQLARTSAGLALLFGMAWFVTETAAIAGVTAYGAVIGFIPLVAFHTQFGCWLALRLALLLILLPLSASHGLRWPALLLAGAAVAIQPMLAHAGAEPGGAGTLLAGDEAIHLLAAGAWLGGLLPLWLSVRRLPPTVGARACARFSRLGLGAVSLVALSGLVLGVGMVGGPEALLATQYGRLILLKSGLFALALVLAGLNRFVFTPDLATGDRHALLASVAMEAGIGLAIVLAAAVLAGLMPGVEGLHRAAQGTATMQRLALWRPALLGLGMVGSCMLVARLSRRGLRHWLAGPPSGGRPDGRGGAGRTS